MENLEAPWVGHEPEEEKMPCCPVCGKECEEIFISEMDGNAIGCEHCIKVVDSWDWEDKK